MWICVACGNHYPAAPEPPSSCDICTDERQWVHPDGQRWTTPHELSAAAHRTDIRDIEPGLIGLGVKPAVGIGQRGMLVTTAEGNLLWDPPGFFDEAAVERVRAEGGLRAVTASHPHFYGAMAEWADLFSAEVMVPVVDQHWMTNPPATVRTWEGSLEVIAGVTLVQCGGHFPGSAVVHWAEGAEGAGALLTGDTIFVAPGEDRVTFVWSAPNRLPLPAAAVQRVVEAVDGYDFDRIYGGWWEPVIRSQAKRILQSSARRYVEIMQRDIATE